MAEAPPPAPHHSLDPSAPSQVVRWHDERGPAARVCPSARGILHGLVCVPGFRRTARRQPRPDTPPRHGRLTLSRALPPAINLTGPLRPAPSGPGPGKPMYKPVPVSVFSSAPIRGHPRQWRIGSGATTSHLNHRHSWTWPCLHSLSRPRLRRTT